jgi:predicted TIM-barrel fold metal-dependent hydrolase
MIIDLHTQIWSSLEQLGPEVSRRLRDRQTVHWEELDGSPAAHDRAMGCVNGSVVIGWHSDRLGAHIPNELIADFVGRDPRRRIGIAGIDPMRESSTDDLEAAIALGLAGVAVSPACQGFHPTHSDAMRIYERCLELSMPVFVLLDDPVAASADLSFARPVLWDEVARTYPELRLVICQLGHPWIDETLLLLGKHDNIYADISGVASRPWQLYNALLNATSFGVMEKLLFGSGFPRTPPAKAIEALYSVNTINTGTQLPAIPRSQIRDIIERDSLACLGIDAEIDRVSVDEHSDRPSSIVADPQPMPTVSIVEDKSGLSLTGDR